MLKKASSKKRRWILAPVSGVLVAAIVAGTLYGTSEDSVARVSLPGIEKINQSNGSSNPFTILEIVPDYDNARVGYFVSGEEPVYYDSEHGVLALADMGSHDERAERYGDDGTLASDFDAYSELKGGPFTYDEPYSEPDYIADPNAAKGTKSFTTYGSFEERPSGATEGDYVDSRTLGSAYKPVVAPSDTDPANANFKMDKILSVNYADTTGQIFDDEIVYNFEVPNGTDDRYVLSFAAIDPSINTSIPTDATFPYQQDSASPNGPFNWSYYVANKVEFTTTYQDETDPSSPYTVSVNIPTDEVVPIYIDRDGNLEEVYDNTSYLGYAYYDDTTKWTFVDIMNGNVKYEDILNDDHVGFTLLGKEYEKLYHLSTNPDITFYALTEYVSWRSGDIVSTSLPENLYYVNDMKQENDEGFATFTEEEKVLRIQAGQDTYQYGFAVDDPLTYHTFYYLENKPDAEYKYYKDDRDPTRDVPRTDATHNFISNYAGNLNETFTYDGGIVNKEWFKKMVLDRDAADCSSTVIDVVTRLASEVSDQDIANADLIYINGDDIYVTGNDLDQTCAQLILESVKKDKAIIIDADSIIKGAATLDTAGRITGVVGANNLLKLAIALSQPNLEDSDINNIISNWNDAHFNDTTYGNKRNKIEKGYTKRSVFVTPYSTVGKAFSKTFTDTITNGATLYPEVQQSITDEVFFLKVAYGDQGYKSTGFNENISFATIVRYILSYGNRRVTTKDEYRVLELQPFYSDIVENKKNTGALGTTFRDKSGTYTDNNFYNRTRDLFDTNWFVKNICEETNAPKVTVTHMGTREFVGKIEDLNTNYDLIYIGADTLYMNTLRSGSEKGKSVVYNDGGLDGKVYTHIGDTFNIEKQRNDGWNATPDIRLDYTKDNYHTGGNDITYEKLRDLTTYVEAGYAVLLSDDFFTYSTDSKISGISSKVDSHSYMYDFLKFCLCGNKYLDANGEVKQVDINSAYNNRDYSHGYIGENVNIKRTFDNNNSTDYARSGKTTKVQREDFVKHMNVGKLEIRLINWPTDYYDEATNTEKHYLTGKGGKYTLDYDVELINTSDVGSPSYDCKLYIDIDADGRYSDTEIQTITSIESGGETFEMSGGKYALSTGREYHITMDVPEGFKGFLSWKLEFVENDRVSVSGNDVVKAAKIGYSAVPEYDGREKINILQILSGDGKGDNASNLDLKDNAMQKLYDQVQDFEIVITQTNAEDFVNKVANENKLNYLMGYDMLVMGFADAYALPANNERNVCEAIYAFREYVLSGRSVLFTHDLTNSTVEFGSSYSASYRAQGEYMNQYLRDLQGMDRYGATQSHLAQLENIVKKSCTPYESRYDNDVYDDIWGNKSAKSTDGNGNLRYDNVGLVQSLMLKYHYNGGNPTGLGDLSFETLNGLLQSQNSWGRTGTIKNAKDNFVTQKISQVNRGQITDYPFHIAEEIPVNMTHSQYYQLNLDTDSQDANTSDDIVVWYALSGDASNGMYYGINKNDVRNNYYIFNKGNITYTGSGHTVIGENQTEERKLFVNTLVAAYSVGNHAPKVTFKESPYSQSANITAKYEPYDIDLKNSAGSEGDTLSDWITVNFKVVNNNLKNNVERDPNSDDLVYKYKDIHVKYYVEDPNGNFIVEEEDANGNKITITLREIDATSDSTFKLKKVADNAGNVLDNPVTISGSDKLLLENYAVYTADISSNYFVSTSVDDEDEDKLMLNRHNVKLYVRASMDDFEDPKPVNGKTTLEGLPGTESLTSLDIFFTELYELK